MKWLAIIVAGALLVSAWAATIPIRWEKHQDAREPIARAARDAHEELLRAEATLREFARADSLLPLLPDSPGVAVVLSPDVDMATADSIRAGLARELAETGTPRVRLGVFLIDGRYGARTPYGGGIEREVYLGSDSSGPYCAMLGTTSRSGGSTRTTGFDLTPERMTSRTARGAGVLGACAFVARYGLPSPSVHAWLRAGGHRFARLRGTAIDRPVPQEQARIWAYQLGAEETLWLRACRAGRHEACRRLLRDDDARPRTGPVAYDMEPSSQPPVLGTLLSDLEAEFGAERFARFWNGGGDVERAFAEAFGTGIESWTHDWSRRTEGSVTLAARFDVVTLLLSVLTVLVLAGIAALVAAHRRIG